MISLIFLLAALFALTWDMPVGYYRFRALCEQEGGLRSFKKAVVADRIRLGIQRFGLAEAAGILKTFSFIKGVEVRDLSETYELATRGGDGKVIKQALGLSENSEGNREEVTAASYLITMTEQSLPFRVVKQRFVLKKPAGEEVAAWTRVVFFWTNAGNTLLGRASAEYCFYQEQPEIELLRPIGQGAR